MFFLWSLSLATVLWATLTGAVVWLNRYPLHVGRRVLWLSLLLLLPAHWYLGISRDDGSVVAHVGGFAVGMLIYSWHELAFYTGVLTGPRPQSLPPAARGWWRLWYAYGTHLYHDLALAFCVAELWLLQGSGSNRTGLLTVLLLWAMQRSAKLNVLLGVRTLQVNLLPAHLRYLGSYWRQRSWNPFFLPSVAAGTLLVAWCWQRAAAAAPSGEAASLAMLGGLAALAIVEHALLMLPWPTPPPHHTPHT